MPTSWDSPSKTFYDWPLYDREICLDDYKMEKFKFNSKVDLSSATSFHEESFPAVDKDKVESSGHTPEDSQTVASRDVDPDSGDSCDLVFPVSKEPKKITKNPGITVSDVMILVSVGVALFLPVVTGLSQQMDCRDLLSNCSLYENDEHCRPWIDKDDAASWLCKYCQWTCICSKLPVNKTMDKYQDHCRTLQHDPECQQRPPAEEFMKDCPFSCYYSRTPDLGSFQTSPKGKTFREGMNVSFECSLNMTSPKVKITWCKNNVPIGPGERVSVNSSSHASILTILGADAANEGEYHCWATNTDYELELSVNSSVINLSIEQAHQETADNTGVIIGVPMAIVVVVGMVVGTVWLVRKKCREAYKQVPIQMN